MVRQFLFFSFAISCLTNCNSSASKNETPSAPTQRQFRNVNWDMTKDEVKKDETATLKNENPEKQTLSYFGITLFAKPAELVYQFDNAKLKKASYFVELDLNEDPIKFYLLFKDSINNKFGKPFSDEIKWRGIYNEMPLGKRNLNEALLSDNASLSTWWSDTVSLPKRLIFLRCDMIYGHYVFNTTNSELQYFEAKKN